MAKKLQITIDEESVVIMDNLKVNQIKSLFVNNAIKAYSKTKDGKSFMKDGKTVNEPEKIVQNLLLLACEHRPFRRGRGRLGGKCH